MKYLHSNRFVTRIILAILLLQGCGSLSVTSPNLPSKTRSVQNNFKQLGGIVNLSPLEGQEFTIEKGYVASFYQEDGRLQADVKIDVRQKRPIYKGLPVEIEQGTDLAGVLHFIQSMQQRRIRLQLPQTGKSGSVFILKSGLSGGMTEGDEEGEKEKEKVDEKEDKKKSVLQKSLSPLARTRKELDLELSFQVALLSQLPPGYELGAAYSEGDCFFDALAQWVNKLNHTDVNTDNYLRMLCHEFYQENKKLVADWDLQDTGEKDVDEEKYAQHEYQYAKIQYTASECDSLFNHDICIWGRPWVEGIMLCRKLQLTGICIIEVFQDPGTGSPVISYHLVTQDGYKSSILEETGQDLVKAGDIPVLVNVQGKLHFVPLWKKEEQVEGRDDGEKGEEKEANQEVQNLTNERNSGKGKNSKEGKQQEKKVDNRLPIFPEDPAHRQLANDILIITGAKPDVRLNTYYRLRKELREFLEQDEDLFNDWNHLWQNLEEPELLVKQDPYIHCQGIISEELKGQVFSTFDTIQIYIGNFKNMLSQKFPNYPQWQQALEEVNRFYKEYQDSVCQVWENPIRFYEIVDSKALMTGEWWPHTFYRINQKHARYLAGLDELGQMVTSPDKGSSTSSHHVSFLPQGKREQAIVYFKLHCDQAPLNPSREYMIYSLYKQLEGIQIPASGLIALSQIQFKKEKKTKKSHKLCFILQASQAVTGITGKEALQQNKQLVVDEEHFSKQVVGTLLTGHVDRKADNFIVTPVEPHYGWVGIDNDGVFQAPIVNSEVTLKSVLLLLTEMIQPLHNAVRTMLTYLNPNIFILEWLTDLLVQENKHTEFKKLVLLQERFQSFSIEDRLLVEKFRKKLVETKRNLAELRKELKEIEKAKAEKREVYKDTARIKEQKKCLKKRLSKLDTLKRGSISRWQELRLPFLDFYDSIIPTLSKLLEKLKTCINKDKENIALTLWDLFACCYPNISACYKELQVKAIEKGSNKSKGSQIYDALRYLYPKKEAGELLPRIELASEQVIQEESYFVEDPSMKPTLSIKERIQELIETTDLNSYSFNEQLLAWIQRVAEIDIWPDKLHASWYDPLLLIRMVKEGASERVIKALVEKAKADIHARDEVGETVLHAAVHQKKDKNLCLEQIKVLVSLGADLETQNTDNRTPLDLAVEQKDIPIFKCLVEQGAGAKVIRRNICWFYQGLSKEEKERLVTCIPKLTDTNPKLGWKLSLDELFPSQQGGNLRTVTKGDRIISQEVWDKLFQAPGIPQRAADNQYGIRAVPFIEKYGQRIYVKFYPQLPGVELAVNRLAEKLLGHCTPYCELASIDGIPVLLTQGIPGNALYEVLENFPERLNFLDLESVSRALILTMLINPGDGLPANYILAPFVNQQGETYYKLICIDNDQSFMPAIAKKVRIGGGWGWGAKSISSLQAKTILYCLNSFKDPVSSKLADKIKNTDLLEILESWLKKLNKDHKKVKKLFNNTSVTEDLKPELTVLGVLLDPGMIEQIFIKLLRLQTVLNKDPLPTYLKVLEILEPDVWRRYEPTLNDNNLNVIEEFKKIEHITKEQALTSSSHPLTHVLASRGMSDPKKFQEALWSGEYGPSKGLDELKKVRGNYIERYVILKEILGDLEELTPENLGKLTAEMLEALVITVDLTKLSSLQQESLLKVIKKQALRTLFLNNCSALTGAIFTSFRLNKLVNLDLSGCPNLEKLTSAFFAGSLMMPALAHLILDNSGISSIHLQAEQLKKLSARNCSKLESIKLLAPQLYRARS